MPFDLGLYMLQKPAGWPLRMQLKIPVYPSTFSSKFFQFSTIPVKKFQYEHQISSIYDEKNSSTFKYITLSG